MRLNRSSYWTRSTGEKIRVKHMTIGELQVAVMQIDNLDIQTFGDDPYIIQQMCTYDDCCNILPTPDPKKDGFLLEDWHDFFCDEITKRLRLLTGLPLIPAPKVVKTNFLVKWFKFW